MLTHPFLIYLSVPVVLMLAVVVAALLERVAWQFQTGLAGLEGYLTGWRERATQQSFHERDEAEFLRWLSMRVGMGPMPNGVDENVIEAQRQSELIHILVDREVPKAVMQCVEIHRVMAHITGAGHMQEIQFEPECYGLRARTVWLLRHTTALVDRYPFKFEDPRVLHNAIVLRKQALPTCCECPYIQLAVDELPDLCPTALLFQHPGGDRVAR